MDVDLKGLVFVQVYRSKQEFNRKTEHISLDTVQEKQLFDSEPSWGTPGGAENLKLLSSKGFEEEEARWALVMVDTRAFTFQGEYLEVHRKREGTGCRLRGVFRCKRYPRMEMNNNNPVLWLVVYF